MTDTAQTPTQESLDALCRSVGRLLSASHQPPARLRLCLDGASVEMEWAYPGSAGPPPGGPVPPAGHPAAGGTEADGRDGNGAGRSHICSPMVGTFYHSSEPGAEPYVRVGDVVRPGQQVGVLEAMKLFNAVEADRPGRVEAILVPDGGAVEYGQPLIVCAPLDTPA